MKIDEEIHVDGLRSTWHLCIDDDQFRFQKDGALIGRFSAKIVLGVIRRYARPLDTAIDPDSESLHLTDQIQLRAWYYRAPVDLENKLYLVLQEEEEVPMAVLARQVSNALRFLSST